MAAASPGCGAAFASSSGSVAAAWVPCSRPTTPLAERVALKLLDQVDAQGIHTIKNEFRTLATIAHPNVVRLHELFGDDEGWYFTMELVAGEHFDRWVRPDAALDELRLRAAFARLLAALFAVHSAGKLHRDLKPSNVLVTADGRVVLLDFGLSTGETSGH